MKILVIVMTSVLLLLGCATTHKDWVPTGGSRSDGVIRLSYEVGPYENPQVDERQAIYLATQRCKVWGYTGAQAFGGVTRQCSNWGGGLFSSGCSLYTVTKEYQCTGTGAPASQ
jgi:hypothetical protein